MFFKSRIRGIVSDFRFDDLFPVNTRNCSELTVGPSIKPHNLRRSKREYDVYPGDQLPVTIRKNMPRVYDLDQDFLSPPLTPLLAACARACRLIPV